MLRHTARTSRGRMNRKYRILFLSQPSTGHVNTLLAMALQVRAEGHYVHFLLPGSRLPFRMIQLVADRFRMLQAATVVPHFLASYNLPFDIVTVPMTVGLKSILLSCATGYRGTRYAFDLMSKGTGYTIPAGYSIILTKTNLTFWSVILLCRQVTLQQR